MGRTWPYLHINALPWRMDVLPRTDNPYVIVHPAAFSVSELDELYRRIHAACPKNPINLLVQDVRCNRLHLGCTDADAVFGALSEIPDLDVNMLHFFYCEPLRLYSKPLPAEKNRSARGESVH